MWLSHTTPGFSFQEAPLGLVYEVRTPAIANKWTQEHGCPWAVFQVPFWLGNEEKDTFFGSFRLVDLPVPKLQRYQAFPGQVTVPSLEHRTAPLCEEHLHFDIP